MTAGAHTTPHHARAYCTTRYTLHYIHTTYTPHIHHMCNDTPHAHHNTPHAHNTRTHMRGDVGVGMLSVRRPLASALHPPVLDSRGHGGHRCTCMRVRNVPLAAGAGVHAPRQRNDTH